MKTQHENLRWYTRNPKLPTSPNDRTVRRLMYASDGQETEVGLVCETARGEYWCFTTNSAIECMPMTEILRHHTELEEACTKLYEYVVSELIRLLKVNTTMPYVLQRRFKERDRAAFNEYLEVRENKAHADVEQAFKCGMDWILRSEGMPRRPGWANYLVQNRNGSFTWHEEKPTPNDNTGEWVSAGKIKPVLLDERWRSSITRLT